MVDANRLPQVLAGSRADRLKRPIDAAGVWLRISRSNGVLEFPVRRDELTEELTPISTLAQTALQTAETKVDAAQVLTLLNSALQNLFQEYPLINGLEHLEIDPIDNRQYTYTVYPIQTAYTGTFEELALVTNDATEALLDVEYGVYKEPNGRIVLVFRDMDAGFTDGIAKIKLVGVPTLDDISSPVQSSPILIAPNPVSAAAAQEIIVTLTGFDLVGNFYNTAALLNGVNYTPLSDVLPGDLAGRPDIRFNSSVFAGQALPAQLTIAVDNLVSAPVTINP